MSADREVVVTSNTYDRIAVDVLRRLFVAADEIGELESPAEWEVIEVLASHAGFDGVGEALELAEGDDGE